MSASSSPPSAASLPKKKARIFSNGRERRAVVFNPTNYFNGDINDEGVFNEPTVPSSSTILEPRVRKTQQCHHHESGESNNMDTDIEYYIESLNKEQNKMDIRCLSLLGLAKKVISPEYRMHLRAHDDMPRIISALKDAPNDATLAFSCAILLFIHNQDKMSSDIDKEALGLMLKLLTVKHSINDIEKKHRDTVVSLCKKMQENGHAKYLKLDEITPAALSEETLLGLNSKRAGSWFNEEIRKLKGIDFILDLIQSTLQVEDVESEPALMGKLEKCLHVLENVTSQNKVNQEYIIKYDDGSFIDSCSDLLSLCKREIAVAVDDQTLKTFTLVLSSTIKVLNNLTSESEISSAIGSRFDLTDLLLYFIHELQIFIKAEQRSDITMVCICLLINMVEFSKPLREYLINDPRMHELIDTFYKRINEAQQTEQQADQLLDSHKKEKMTEAMQDSIINQVIVKSGKHMEHSIIAACLAILFGCLIQDNNDYKQLLTSYLTKGSYAPLIDVLQKLQEFAHLADIMTTTGVNRVKRILKVLKM